MSLIDQEIPFVKGHGTGNDFVLITDDDGDLDFTADQVARIVDRRFGVGADGFIRAVPLRGEHGLVELDDSGRTMWFMDYRNADGSLAEMCGNGIRVFGEYLVSIGEPIEVGDTVEIATRAGVKDLRREVDGWAADLGEWQVDDSQVLVAVAGLEVDRPGVSVDVGNPHVVVALAEDAELDALDLSHAPVLDPPAPHGANVEFVVPADPLVENGVGSIRMRVHERGSGETLSCGTGAVAAALATRYWAGAGAPDEWQVDVPGGTLHVTVIGTRVELSGPAELVFSGSLTPPAAAPPAAAL